MNSFRISRGMIWGAALALAVATVQPVWGDTHDNLVYQRYGHKVTSGKIHYEFGMKFTELMRPATQQDVEKGAAVFTFEGLGPSRIWKPPECPMYCEWPSLKDFPFENNLNETNFHDSGYVCQAEELQVNGQWKRYFGFVCEHGVAVVPAEEVYLWFDECCPSPSIKWNKLPGGSDLGILGPDEKMQNGTIVSVKLNVGDSLPVELFVRNRRGAPQKVLRDVYRDAKNQGPAFHRGITLSLGWAPFDTKNPNKNYPQMEEFKTVSPIRTNFFTDGEVGDSLTTGEMTPCGIFDIRDWFNVTAPGYYQYHFEFNPAQLGLPTDEGNGGGIYFGFVVGTEPRRLTIEELNREIPVLGDPGKMERIRTLIRQNMANAGTSTTNELKSPPIPKKILKLDYTPFMGDNMSGMESEVVQLSIPNADFLDSLEHYDKVEARIKLEALMRDEKVLPMKLLLASAAMAKGSKTAAFFVLECMTNTDYPIAHDTQDALRLALNHCQKNPPDWLIEMTIAALSDERYVTGLQKAHWSDDTFFSMSYLADEHADITRALGYLQCTNAVPFLIELAKKTNGRRGPVMALGMIGDQRATPVLIDFVKQKGPSTTLKGGQVLNDDFLRPVEALSNLHAKEAVPILLEYIQFPDVIEALEQISDSRVIEPLRKLILANGKIGGITNDAELETNRLSAAQIAVASLDPLDCTAKLCELLTDTSFNQYQRRSVVWRLGNQPDSRAIPFLAKAIKTDPSGAVVNQAINVMAAFKYKTAVDALIDCFNADFSGKQDWKRAYKPEMFRNNIADSLHLLTGKQIGANKEEWLKWWKQNRDAVSDLK